MYNLTPKTIMTIERIQKFENYKSREGFNISPTYAKLLNVIKDDEDRLLICVRGDEYHVYYRGGKILEIKPKSLYFDLKYLKREGEANAEFSFAKNKDQDKLILDNEKVLDNPKYFLKEAKSIMDVWFEKNKKQERDDQHLIAYANKDSDNELTVIDIEFAVSFNANYYNKKYIDNSRKETGLPPVKDKYPNPRFDIIAIDKDGRIHVIELKTGLEALDNARKHVDDFNAMIGNEEEGDNRDAHEIRYVSFLKELQGMRKRIIGENLRGSVNIPEINIELKPKFHFLFTPKRGDNVKYTEEEQSAEFTKHIEALSMDVDIIKVDSNYILSL